MSKNTPPLGSPHNGTPSENNAANMSAREMMISLWQFMRPYKKVLFGAGVALVFTAGITLAIGQGVRLLVDQGLTGDSSEALAHAVLVLLVLAGLMALGTYARHYLVSWLGERVVADLRKAVFDHIVTLHPSYFETNRSGEIMSRLTTDTTLLQHIIGTSFSMALRSSLMFVGALILLLFTNLKLSLIVLIGVPLVLLPIVLYGRRVRKLSKASQDSIADVGSYAGEIIQHIKTVQSYTRERDEMRAFAAEVEIAFDVAKRRIRQRSLLIAVVILLMFGAVSGLLWVGGNDMIAGRMSSGDLAAFVFYAVMMGSAVATISEVYGELQRATGATERLMDLLHVESQIPASTGMGEADRPFSDAGGHVVFDGVDFSYPTRPDHPAIHHLDLDVPAGKSLALVGPSGAGKSTLLELLQRFYDPLGGRITLDGVDIREMDTGALRKYIAVVPQQPALFTADVWYNIRYGKPDASDEEVIAAARAAHADEFIEQLPEGYNSHLGEQGTRLSGGQKQRIAIARAILKDPKILLLDEATSALDAESEYHVQQALQTLMKNRTTIIIAHRLATILHADSIAVLERGALVAQGSHRELVDISPLYKRLAELQFQDSERRMPDGE
ncbi:ABC transporter transmembrane domain-containing protein [Microbulbifer hydrolyticus]|uniref:ATP-binding cassette domain-containing protein n=1 Tax=Microbulbifer hydrolyticus TaxID=48074 RepID=A0A6P1TBH2_9GAMM|nr:ATP-binding cassette subfamily B protein [Microbulbifer hydrolyticus]QHQ38002.1 ATP-binding cassette domain-containing protein [Microbulbifer hydrolyticus]